MSRWKMPLECIWSIAFSNWNMNCLILSCFSGIFRPAQISPEISKEPLMCSYKLQSISSKTRASLPVGWSLRYLTLNISLLEDFQEFHDVLVRRQLLERLDFSQLVHLIDRSELALHALDCHVLTRLQGLSLDHL